jgi:hypothetical protein
MDGLCRRLCIAMMIFQKYLSLRVGSNELCGADISSLLSKMRRESEISTSLSFESSFQGVLAHSGCASSMHLILLA